MTVQQLSVVIAGTLAACVPPPQAPTPAVYVSAEASASSEHAQAVPPASPPGMQPVASWSAVQVLVDKRVDRPTEVVGVLDFHSSAADENKGFDELRAHAAAMGADAVLGAEFEHGEGAEPSHLSGMAVRFLDR